MTFAPLIKVNAAKPVSLLTSPMLSPGDDHGARLDRQAMESLGDTPWNASDLSTRPTLPIVEMFHSLQGEGAWAGTNAFFIRLAGCDVGCTWCDTKQSWNAKNHPLWTIENLVAAAQAVNPRLVVITGGEPLMHDLTALTDALHREGLHICLETSGAHPMSGTFDWVTLSPKRRRPPHGSVYAQAQELKVVIQEPADLDWAEAQATQVTPTTLKFLQPEWTTPESQELVFNYVLSHPEWIVSIQTHKYLDIR